MADLAEQLACIPTPINPNGFNPNVELPYGLKNQHISSAMTDFLDFLGFINQQLYTREIERLENMLMPANFSSIVGEFMGSTIPKYCSTLVKNQYHNGHPDLLPANFYLNNAGQHVTEGVEIKGSRYAYGWQGHNPEEVWLMVFVFDSNRPTDITKGIQPKPFRFIKVIGAKLTKEDWTFSGRSETSRRTITASVNNTGYQKMTANWIYKSSNNDS
jgi:hypothetical protein